MENENQTDLEEVINEVENETPQVEEVVEEQPKLDLEKFESKDDDAVAKVDLNQPPANEEVAENNPNDPGVARVDESPEPTQEQEEVLVPPDPPPAEAFRKKQVAGPCGMR